MSIDMFQEWKTDKTLSALKKLSTPHITVLRDNKKTEISSIDLLPGDIMYIHEGIKIPADGHIIKSNNLKVDESLLTGESLPVHKTSKELGLLWNILLQGNLLVFEEESFFLQFVLDLILFYHTQYLCRCVQLL